MAVNPQTQTNGPAMKDGDMKTWMMVVLTVLFVGLYALALLGIITPLADSSVVSRLEPIIFVIIGYYFGRLPSVQTEKALKSEIERKTGEEKDARREKDQAIGAKSEEKAKASAIEQKLHDVKATLATTLADGASPQSRAMLSGTTDTDDGDAVRRTVAAALNILDS